MIDSSSALQSFHVTNTITMIFKTMGFRLLFRHSAKNSIAQEERLDTPPAARDSSEVTLALNRRSLSLSVGFFILDEAMDVAHGPRHMRTLYTCSLNRELRGQHGDYGTRSYA